MSREQDFVIAEWCEPGQDINWDGLPDNWMDLNFTTKSTGGFWVAAIYDGELFAWEPAPLSTDLNAMAEAEKVVRERGLKREYGTELGKIILSGPKNWTIGGIGVYKVTTATAPQRAEALCRVIEAK